VTGTNGGSPQPLGACLATGASACAIEILQRRRGDISSEHVSGIRRNVS
jgi:hypothetical protein